MMKQRWGLDRNVLRPTPGDPWGVEQHHWNTGAEENQQLNPGGPSNMLSSLCSPTIVSDINTSSSANISNIISVKSGNSWTALIPLFSKRVANSLINIENIENNMGDVKHPCLTSVIYLFHVMIHWWVRKPSRWPNNCMFWAMIEVEGEVVYP